MNGHPARALTNRAACQALERVLARFGPFCHCAVSGTAVAGHPLPKAAAACACRRFTCELAHLWPHDRVVGHAASGAAASIAARRDLATRCAAKYMEGCY